MLESNNAFTNIKCIYYLKPDTLWTYLPERDSTSKQYSLSHKLRIKVYFHNSHVCLKTTAPLFHYHGTNTVNPRDSYGLFWFISQGYHTFFQQYLFYELIFYIHFFKSSLDHINSVN